MDAYKLDPLHYFTALIKIHQYPLGYGHAFIRRKGYAWWNKYGHKKICLTTNNPHTADYDPDKENNYSACEHMTRTMSALPYSGFE